MMINLRRALLIAVGVVLWGDIGTAQAQFYGIGGFGGYGGYGGFGGYGGWNMAGFSPPGSIGGYYPPPLNVMPPAYVGGYPYNPGVYGFATPGVVPYGGMANGTPFAGYPGFGWWPLSASDVKATAVPNPASQGSSLYSPGYPDRGMVNQQELANISVNQTVAHTGETIKLTCPKVAAGSLSYLLNGYPYTIQPGYSQTFPDDRVWKLEFRRSGQESELVGYTLKPGHYNFAVGPGGWELRQVVSLQPGSDIPPAPHPTPITAPVPTPAPSKPPTTGSCRSM